MGGINIGRWIVGGVVAGALIWIIEGVASVFYMEEMEAAMAAHGLGMEMTAAVWTMSVVVSLVVGLTLVFLYAAARPRFGAGPKTAVIVALALYVGGYLVSLCGYRMLGLFPDAMLVKWAAVGLVEMLVAGLMGGWIYRE